MSFVFLVLAAILCVGLAVAVAKMTDEKEAHEQVKIKALTPAPPEVPKKAKPAPAPNDQAPKKLAPETTTQKKPDPRVKSAPIKKRRPVKKSIPVPEEL